MKPSRIVAVVVGTLLTFPAIAFLFGGGALSIIYGTQRDDDGFFDVNPDQLVSATAAITAEDLDLGTDPGPPRWLTDAFDVTFRLRAEGVDDTELFLGIAPQEDLDAYLANVAHDEIDEITGMDFDVSYVRREGTAAPAIPGEQVFWAVQDSGAGEVEVMWQPEAGEWGVVIMNADGSAPVAADVNAAIKAPVLIGVGIGLIVGGALLMALAVFLIVWGGRGRRAEEEGEPAATVVGPVAEETVRPEPVRLAARLDPELSTWKWLVKWFLAIPHFIVLALLWVAFTVLTFFAGIAILFTGRYPRGIFDFNVGVLRWTWRVSYYALEGGLGTDQYPPFSLALEPMYPATLDIEYPQQLSRGLVLVKWWLLAIPHYIALAMIGGWWTDWRVGDNAVWAGGLLSILVIVAGVSLLFTERYPRGLFDLIVGLNRWIYRVIAYAALMTDRYPPFRLDQGGSELVPHGGPTPAPSDTREPTLTG
jgi:hypothetical protein